MIYTEDCDYEKLIFDINPEVIAHIAQNLDTDLFRVDNEGYSYYGFFVDKDRRAIVVTTKSRNDDPIRMIFDGSDNIRIEGAGRELLFPIGNKRMTLNRILREHFDVPHAIDRDDPNYADLCLHEEDTRCRWRTVHKDTL